MSEILLQLVSCSANFPISASVAFCWILFSMSTTTVQVKMMADWKSCFTLCLLQLYALGDLICWNQNWRKKFEGRQQDCFFFCECVWNTTRCIPHRLCNRCLKALWFLISLMMILFLFYRCYVCVVSLFVWLTRYSMSAAGGWTIPRNLLCSSKNFSLSSGESSVRAKSSREGLTWVSADAISFFLNSTEKLTHKNAQYLRQFCKLILLLETIVGAFKLQ